MAKKNNKNRKKSTPVVEVVFDSIKQFRDINKRFNFWGTIGTHTIASCGGTPKAAETICRRKWSDHVQASN